MEGDYRRPAEGCASAAPDLNRMVYVHAHAYRPDPKLLIPDHSADHHDDLHLGIARSAAPSSVGAHESITAQR